MTTRSNGPESDRVLIAEDDAAQRVGLQQLLKSWGFAVESAADGEDALAKAPSFRPTIVLSDMVMPKMGGLDLLAALRQEDPDLTVVLMTGQGTVETAVTAIKQGAYDYLRNRSIRSGSRSCSTRSSSVTTRTARCASCDGSCRSAARSAG